MLSAVVILLIVLVLSLNMAAGEKSHRQQGYDQFHPSGRILQVEYAKMAVTRKGGPIAALRCKDGILLITARALPRSILQIQSDRKIFFVDKHICVAISGLIFDANAVVGYMKRKCVQYKVTYGCPIPVEVLCDDTASVLHSMTLKGDSRPIAVNFVVAGIDKNLGPQLFTMDLAGTFDEWKAVAVGSGSEKIMDDLLQLKSIDSSETIQNAWPHFKSTIIKTFFRETTETIHESTTKKDSDELSAAWDVEAYIGTETSNGAVCWSRIDDNELK
mmetsp:Transcript_1797/g.2477  ORF Transcript_1797/g.2477 Transcript_1797/m.2477 type:complete len:274 (+) Transcript_1797:32-853(+)